MGASVFKTLKNHSTLLARIQYAMKGVLTIDLMKEIFGIENIFVQQAASHVVSAVLLPFQAAPAILFYYDLRIRKEAFDLQLLSRSLSDSPMPA